MNSSGKTVVKISRALCESRRFSRIISINYTSQGEKTIEENEVGERRHKQGDGTLHEMTKKGTREGVDDDDYDELKKKASKEQGGKPVDEDKGTDVNWRPIVEKKPSDQSSS